VNGNREIKKQQKKKDTINIAVTLHYTTSLSANFFFSQLVALGWGVALAQGLAGLTPGPALPVVCVFLKDKSKFLDCDELLF
jgi:hypothetical protein